MRTAIYTVAYPGPYLPTYAREYFDSLAAQSDRDFDVVVFNDGADYLMGSMLPPTLRIRVEPVSGPASALRCQAIRRLLQEGYEMIVFADIDDCFAPNRIEVSKKLIAAGKRIIFNELDLFGADFPEPQPLFAGRIEDGAIFDADAILHANCLGLSNTAVHRDAITEEALQPEEVIVFDWLFYSRLLLAGQNAQFTLATKTLYRQHQSNLATLTKWRDPEIRRGVRVKQQHYSALRKYSAHGALASEFAEIGARMDNDHRFAADYCNAVRASALKQPLWWEPIKTRKELEL